MAISRMSPGVRTPPPRWRRAKNACVRYSKAADDAIFTVDPDGSLMSLNPAGQSMFGYTVENIIGARVESLNAGLEPGILARCDDEA